MREQVNSIAHFKVVVEDHSTKPPQDLIITHQIRNRERVHNHHPFSTRSKTRLELTALGTIDNTASESAERTWERSTSKTSYKREIKHSQELVNMKRLKLLVRRASLTQWQLFYQLKSWLLKSQISCQDQDNMDTLNWLVKIKLIQSTAPRANSVSAKVDGSLSQPKRLQLQVLPTTIQIIIWTKIITRPSSEMLRQCSEETITALLISTSRPKTTITQDQELTRALVTSLELTENS